MGTGCVRHAVDSVGKPCGPLTHVAGNGHERGPSRRATEAVELSWWCRGGRSRWWPSRVARLVAQDRCGAVQGLDLGFLVHADPDRLLGRIQVETADVADIGVKLGIGGELECLPFPRQQVVIAPDPGDRVKRDPQLLCQQSRRPVRHTQVLRGCRERLDHNLKVVDDRRATRAGQVTQPADPRSRVPVPPEDHRRP